MTPRIAPGSRGSAGMGDEVINALIILLMVIAGIAVILRAAGAVVAWIAGAALPEAGPAAGLGVLFSPGDPATALAAEGCLTASDPHDPAARAA